MPSTLLQNILSFISFPVFAAQAERFYGRDNPKPVASHDNVWEIYRTLLAHFESIQTDEEIQTVIAQQAGMPAVGEDADGEEGMALLPLKRPLRKVFAAMAESSGSQYDISIQDINDPDGDSDEEVPHNIFTDDSSSSCEESDWE